VSATHGSGQQDGGVDGSGEPDGRAREVAALAESARARVSREGPDGLARTSLLGDVSTEVGGQSMHPSPYSSLGDASTDAR
jgi:hypothetical protein